MFRNTAGCNDSSLISPDGSTPAALARLLSTLRSHKSLDEQTASRLFYLFARLHLLSSDCFSSLIFSLLRFSSLFPPAFSCVHTVKSLTSKLPSSRKEFKPHHADRSTTASLLPSCPQIAYLQLLDRDLRFAL